MSLPYSLSNFLPAGTVQISLSSGVAPTCYHVHAEDGWHAIDLNFDSGIASPASEDLVKSLMFLVQQQFIAATYRIIYANSSAQLLIARIYLIPYDLAGVNGRLSYNARKRENGQVLGLARRYMSNLLPQIMQDQESWAEGQVHSSFHPIIEYSAVSIFFTFIRLGGMFMGSYSRTREHCLKYMGIYLHLSPGCAAIARPWHADS